MKQKFRTLLGAIGINVLDDKQMSYSFFIKTMPLTYMLNKSCALRFCRGDGTLPADPLITKTHIHITTIAVGSLELNPNVKLVSP